MGLNIYKKAYIIAPDILLGTRFGAGVILLREPGPVQAVRPSCCLPARSFCVQAALSTSWYAALQRGQGHWGLTGRDSFTGPNARSITWRVSWSRRR